MRRLFCGYELLKAGFFAAAGAALAFRFTPPHDRAQCADTVKAAEIGIPQPPSSFSNSASTPLTHSKQINSVGLPAPGHIRTFDGYLCAYDRRSRIPLWVMEHLTPSKLAKDSADAVNRFVYSYNICFLYLRIICHLFP